VDRPRWVEQSGRLLNEQAIEGESDIVSLNQAE